MTDNDAAINALVEKDREENFRPNNLRAESDSWDGKLFHLNLDMNVKASPANQSQLVGISMFNLDHI